MDPTTIGKQIQQTYPQYAKVDPAVLGNKYLQKYGAAVSGVQGGQLDIKDIPEAQRAGVSIGLQAVGFDPTKSIASTTKLSAQQVNLGKSGVKNIQDVKELFLNDPNVLSKQLIPGQFLSRKFDSALYDSVDALLRLRTGAQANPSEIRGYMNKIGPTFGDSPETVAYKLQKLENDLKISAGQEPDAKAINVSKIGPSKTGNAVTDNLKNNPVVNFLLGGAINVAQDIGAGIRAGRESRSLNKQELLATQLEQQAQQTQAPEERKALLSQANQIRSTISSESQDISRSFSPEVKNNPILRGIGAASQIAATAELPAFFQGLLKTGTKVLHPFKTVGDMRAAAIAEASGKTISGNKVVTALEKGVEEVSPTAEAGYKRFLDIAKGKYAGKELTIDQVVKLNSAANDAYTAAGRVGKASTAKFNKVLGDVLKDELKVTAPDVAKANEFFKLLYGAGQITKRIAPAALLSYAIYSGARGITNRLQGK